LCDMATPFYEKDVAGSGAFFEVSTSSSVCDRFYLLVLLRGFLSYFDASPSSMRWVKSATIQSGWVCADNVFSKF